MKFLVSSAVLVVALSNYGVDAFVPVQKPWSTSALNVSILNGIIIIFCAFSQGNSISLELVSCFGRSNCLNSRSLYWIRKQCFFL